MFNVGDVVRIRGSVDPEREVLYHGFLAKIEKVRYHSKLAYVNSDSLAVLQKMQFSGWFNFNELDLIDEQDYKDAMKLLKELPK